MTSTFLFLTSLASLHAAELELQAKEWASETLLGSPVGITVDPQGRVYVTQTVRRKESELDIRSHMDWVIKTLSLESVAERQAFYESEMSAANHAKNASWLKDRNGDGISDFRDLGVLSEKILRISDTKDQGVADLSEVFVDGLNDEMTGVAGGVYFHDGQIYLAAIPRVWKFSEDRVIGKADFSKEVMLEGFGVHIAYSGHDMHGFTIGPDGRLYWSIGDKGLNVNTREGAVEKKAHEGAVMRCELDGSHFEIFAHGLRNPQEIAFDQWGNLFSVDNDGDFKGERERFVYITEQSDTGWRCNWQYRGGGYNPWMDEKLAVPYWKGQAAYITPPLLNYSDGPCGFVYNPGTALGESLRDTFFLTQFPGRKLTAFQVDPNGAGFSMKNERLVHSGTMMTGLAWGPDGALYVADWNSAVWEPHNKGKVWQIDVAEAKRDATRKQTQAILRAGWDKRSVKECVSLLAHGDQRVRLGAQFSLVKQSAIKELLEVAQSHSSLLARCHAIWGLGQMGRKDAKLLLPLIPLLKDAESEVRAQVAKVLGDAAVSSAGPKLAAALSDASMRVKYHAAIALGKTGEASQLPAVLTLLASVEDRDVFLRHAGITALAGIGKKDPALISAFHRDHREAVRLAVVVALRRLAAPQVSAFLADEAPLVRAECARAIHDDDSIVDALPALAKSLEGYSGNDPVFLRRAISANLRIGGAEAASRLATYAISADAPAAMREEALKSLSTWLAPEPLDRVEGRYRSVAKRPAAELKAALDASATALLGDSSESVRKAACEMIRQAEYRSANAMLQKIVANAQEKSTVRCAALQTLGALGDEKISKSTTAALHSDDAPLRSVALNVMARSGKASDSVVSLLEKVLTAGKIAEVQDAYACLGVIKSPAAVRLLQDRLTLLREGKIAAEVRLDLLSAAQVQGNAGLTAAVKAYEGSSDAPAMEKLRDTLTGGSAERGKKIAIEHLAAQCTRCHKLGGEGAEVGPDLSGIGKRMNRKQLLEALILPNATLAKGYALVAVTLKDGTSLSGSLEKESATDLILRMADGSVKTISLANVAERTSPASMMPPMDAMLGKKEIRDVIEYLTTLR
jgi:putative membrane-bound dehydrogenase-like protein